MKATPRYRNVVTGEEWNGAAVEIDPSELSIWIGPPVRLHGKERMSDEIFSKGDLIVLTKGEYSSYSISGVVRALRDFTVDEACVLHGNRPRTYGFPMGENKEQVITLQSLLDAGFVEEVQNREFWLKD